MPGNAMVAFKVHFKAGWLFCPKLPLCGKSAVHKNICCWSYFGLKDLHEFIFAGGTIGNKFVSKFKMSLGERMLVSIETAHFKFTLIRLNNKSLPKSFVLMAQSIGWAKQLFTWFNTSDSLSILEGQGKPFLCICRVIIYRNVAMLLEPSLSWLARVGTGGMSVTQVTRITICPRHRPLLGRFYRAPKSCQVTSLAGKHVINFQMPNDSRSMFSSW